MDISVADTLLRQYWTHRRNEGVHLINCEYPVLPDLIKVLDIRGFLMPKLLRELTHQERLDLREQLAHLREILACEAEVHAYLQGLSLITLPIEVLGLPKDVTKALRALSYSYKCVGPLLQATTEALNHASLTPLQLDIVDAVLLTHGVARVDQDISTVRERLRKAQGVLQAQADLLADVLQIES